MAKKMMLIVNPNAGKSQYKSILSEVLNEFSAADIIPTVFFSRYPGHIPDLVEANALDYDIVACIGGDGTLSETAFGLMRLPEQRPVGYIPMGTTNDVARTLGLDHKQPLECARRIIEGEPVSIDIGQFGPDKFFAYIAAFGAFTDVSYATPQEAKQTLGHLAYTLEGIKQLPKLSGHHAVIEYDDGVINDDFIFGAITNSTSVAGFLKLDSNRVSLSDGLFEVLLIKTPKALKDLNDIITSILSNNFNNNNVFFLKSKEIRIMFDEAVAWTRDGEDGGSHQDVVIFNRSPGIEVIV